MKPLPLFLSIAVVCLLSGAAAASAGPAPSGGQLGRPLEWIAPPARPDIRHLGQRTADNRLLLTPNNGFFPRLGLAASGAGSKAEADKLNGGKSFAHVAGWDQGEAMEWGVWIYKPAEARATVKLDNLAPGDRFVLHIDERPASELNTVIRLAEGFHTIRLEKTSPGASKARFRVIELSVDGAALRKRWRPAAAHTRFSSSEAVGGIRLWVMEMDAAPGELGFYSPITTPFGYYGPTWKADGTVNSGFNFSLWSYGRGKREPPIEQLSHLIAVGHPEAKFSGFGHEGTGVKIRGWEPLKGRQGQRQAIALRVEPGPKYDTYYSWFYATDEKRWRLFGAGRKFNKCKPLKSLWVGSFVEVPGPPQRQRTGPYPRRMRYRGWVMDAEWRWSRLDRMSNGNVNKQTGLTHTDRGLTADGRFYLQTGGWEFRKPTGRAHVEAPGNAGPLPEFMRPEALEPLLGMSCAVEKVIARRSGVGVDLGFNVRNLGNGARVTVHHGASEGLTFADRWEHEIQVVDPKEGANKVAITVASPGKPFRARILLENHEGKFWSDETVLLD